MKTAEKEWNKLQRLRQRKNKTKENEEKGDCGDDMKHAIPSSKWNGLKLEAAIRRSLEIDWFFKKQPSRGAEWNLVTVEFSI